MADATSSSAARRRAGSGPRRSVLLRPRGARWNARLSEWRCAACVSDRPDLEPAAAPADHDDGAARCWQICADLRASARALRAAAAPPVYADLFPALVTAACLAAVEAALARAGGMHGEGGGFEPLELVLPSSAEAQA